MRAGGEKVAYMIGFENIDATLVFRGNHTFMDEEAGGFCSPNYLSQREAQGVIKCDGFLSKENHSAKRRKEEPSNNPANLGFFKSRPEDKTNALTHEEFYQMVLEEDKATVEQRFGIDLNEYFDYLCKKTHSF